MRTILITSHLFTKEKQQYEVEICYGASMTHVCKSQQAPNTSRTNNSYYPYPTHLLAYTSTIAI